MGKRAEKCQKSRHNIYETTMAWDTPVCLSAALTRRIQSPVTGCWWPTAKCAIVEIVHNTTQLHTVHTTASKSSIRRFVITEKAPTRAFSWLKAATTAFTFKTLSRHYAKWVLTQGAYTGEIIQERRSFKATFEAVTSPRRKWAALAAVTTVLDYIASSFSSHDRDIYGNNWEKFWFI